MIDELEEGDYQTLYVKEEYLEDHCQDDDYAHVHLTSGKASHKQNRLGCAKVLKWENEFYWM